MAQLPAVTKLGETYRGLITGGQIPFELRDIPMDSLMTKIFSDIAAFSSVIHTKMGNKSKEIPERTLKVSELKELDRYMTVTVASTDTYHKTFSVSNEQAAQMQPDELYAIKGLYSYVRGTALIGGQVYAASGGSQGTNIGPDLNFSTGVNPTSIQFSRTRGINAQGDAFTDYEVVKILSIGGKDSGGTGNTQVTVERCWHGPGSSDIGGAVLNRSLVYSTSGITGTTNGGSGSTPADAIIQIGDDLLRLGNSYKEGTNAPNGLTKNPNVETVFTQEFKYALEYTLESGIVRDHLKTWFREGEPLNIQRVLIGRRMTRDKDGTYLLGRKGKSTDITGREEYLSGGAFEFVPKDSKHYLRYPAPALTWDAMLDMGKSIFGVGGSKVRFCPIGITADAEFRKMFYKDGHMQFDKSASDAFDIEVNSLIVSGGKLLLLPTQVMEDYGYGSQMGCFDLDSGPAFVPIHNAGWNMRHFPDIAEKGSSLYKEAIVDIYGLERRYAQYHTIVDFSNCF